MQECSSTVQVKKQIYDEIEIQDCAAVRRINMIPENPPVAQTHRFQVTVEWTDGDATTKLIIEGSDKMDSRNCLIILRGALLTLTDRLHDQIRGNDGSSIVGT